MAASAPAPRRFRIAGRVLATALVAIGAAGCGPVTSTMTINEATVAVEAAQAVEADRYAVYEYVSAVECLQKAKEEEGFSDFQAAIDLARKSRDFAEKARQRALASPQRGTLRPGEMPVPEGELDDEELPNVPDGSHL
jgi:hypothetical protein